MIILGNKDYKAYAQYIENRIQGKFSLFVVVVN